MLWVKKRSWHAPRPKDQADKAYCGQDLTGLTETSDALPGSSYGKSCESCLAITRRIDEHAEMAGRGLDPAGNQIAVPD